MAQIADHNLHAFDAYCVFQHAIIHTIRLYGENSDEYKIMSFMLSSHFKKMSEEFFESEKKSLGLVTSIDLSNYGKSLCKPFFLK